VAAVVLGATSIAMTEAAEKFEIGSFALITALGAWLTWRKVIRPLSDGWAERYAPVPIGGVTLAYAASHAALVEADTGHHQHGHHHHHGHDHHHDHHHADGASCDHCGHMPSPELAKGRLDWSKAWAAVAAVGMRPCTGALIVLVFALSQGLFAAGIAAAFAMAIGTGLTVAALTLAAVSARGLAARLSGDGETGHMVHHGFEGLGALVVLGFGVLMLGASLSG
jgi:nickel/cobalt exporter